MILLMLLSFVLGSVVMALIMLLTKEQNVTFVKSVKGDISRFTIDHYASLVARALATTQKQSSLQEKIIRTIKKAEITITKRHIKGPRGRIEGNQIVIENTPVWLGDLADALSHLAYHAIIGKIDTHKENKEWFTLAHEAVGLKDNDK